MAQQYRIAIVRALQLGDLLTAVPALRSIRAGFREAEITLIGLPWAASFARRFSSYVDRFVEFPGYPGLSEMPVDTATTAQFLAEQQDYSYDLVVQMHGSGEISNRLALDMRGGRTAGYYSGGRPAQLSIAAPYPDDRPEIHRNLALARLLGCPGRGTRLEFPLFGEDRWEAAALLRRIPRTARIRIGMHPGARPSARRWPAEYFAAVADDLTRRFDAAIVLTGGADEVHTVQAVIDRMKTRAINVVGETSLGGLAALIDRLALFITNDTGPSHIACAVDTPSITLFGPADALRWAPLDTQRHPITRRAVSCSPCSYTECPIDHRCLRWLRPARVTALAEHLLTAGVLPCSA